MADIIRFTVPALPIPQPRHQVGTRPGKDGKRHGHAFIDTAHPIHVFKAAVKMAAHAAYDGPPLTGPVYCSITATFPRPKKHFGTGRNAGKIKERYADPWMDGNKDWDNIGKAVCDALNRLIYEDDKQIVIGKVQKKWAAAGEQPSVGVLISAMTKQEPDE